MKRFIISLAALLATSCTLISPESNRTSGRIRSIGMEMFDICLESPAVGIIKMVSSVEGCNEPGFSTRMQDQTMTVTRIDDNVWNIEIETLINKCSCKGSLVAGYSRDPKSGAETLTCVDAVLYYDEGDGYGAVLTIKDPFVYALYRGMSVHSMDRRGVCHINFTRRGEVLDWCRISWNGDYYSIEDSI